MKCPTEKQYGIMRPLASGAAGLSRKKRDTEPLLRRGWVTAELRGGLYQWVRITPHGLRALALAVERYGLPDLGPEKDREPPLVQRLREARDTAREETRVAEAEARRRGWAIARIGEVLNQEVDRAV